MSLRYALFFWVLVLASASVSALTLEEVEARHLEMTANADETLRSQLEPRFARAKAALEAQQEFTRAAADHQRVAARGAEVRRELAEKIVALTRSKGIPGVTQRERTLDAAAIENLLENTRSERVGLEGKLGGYELKLRALALRPQAIEEEKRALNQRGAELDAAREQGVATSDTVLRAERIAQEAEYLALQAQLEMLNQEQVAQPTREENIRLRRDATVLDIERLSARTAALEALLLERREAETQTAQAAAEQVAAGIADMSPEAQRVSEENRTLGRDLADTIARQSKTVDVRSALELTRQRLQTDIETARQRLQLAGTSSGLGRILVDQRRRLPRIDELRRQSSDVIAEVTRVGLQRIELDERQRFLREVLSAPNQVSVESNPRDLRNLREAQQALLGSLDASYASYLKALDSVDSELQQLVSHVQTYQALLDERLLWIPNEPALSAQVITRAIAEINDLRITDDITSLATATTQGLRQRMLLAALAVGIVLFLFRARRRVRAHVEILRAQTFDQGDAHIGSTLRWLGLISVIALPVAVLLFVLSRMIALGSGTTPFGSALEYALQLAAALTFFSRWCAEAAISDGLFTSHFQAAPALTSALRAMWRRFTVFFIPTYSAALGLDLSMSSSTLVHTVQRVLFLLAMASLSVFAYRAIQRLRRSHAAGSANQAWRTLWWLLIILPPTVFALLSGIGYHYTARELSAYFLLSMLLLASGLLVYRLSLRWIELASTRFGASPVNESGDAETESERKLALNKFRTQALLVARNVVGWSLALGLLAVWQPVIPALNFFDDLSLWSISFKDAAGAVTVQPITLASLLAALVILVITVVASRNLPGVLDIGVLQRLRVHHGSRYAITSLLQYVIVAVGLSMVLSTLGLRWSQVQWLVAALGVGLGFGLQEIFANFISGLILLFERPVRVGDVVTIGDMSGKVTRIQIRATTIRDMDNKEIVVPNKTFITERFVNWTLSDQVTRVVIQVGIAYGADVAQAVRLLLELACAHPKVMDEPAPQAVLVGFGDSALNIELQVYAEELVHRSDVRHELYSAIYAAFSRHGIEIPYPQRDVHVKSVTAASALVTSPQPSAP